MMKLLNIDANAKTVKGQSQGYLTAVLYLAPANASGYEVCPKATEGCRKACLNTAGRGGMALAKATFAPHGVELPDNTIQRARIARTRWYFEDRAAFMAQLHAEITAFVKQAERKGFIPCVRLNGTSDIPWERVPHGAYPSIIAAFPGVQFYDYTKRANRRNLPPNYHLTFSLAEDNDAQAAQALDNGMNVAVVFRTKALPPYFSVARSSDPNASLATAEVVNGDESDLRFLDKPGVFVGLYAKGAAKHDTSGFVRSHSYKAA